jgi:hypothetical protein
MVAAWKRRAPATMRSAGAVATYARTGSTIRSMRKPCASIE